MSSPTLSVDLRWIDNSGIGTYLKGIMPGVVYHLHDIPVIGIGDRARLEQFSWSKSANVKVIDCQPARYSLADQIALPRSIPPTTTLFFAPHYPIPLLYKGQLAVTVHDMSHLVVPEIRGNWKKRLYADTMFRTLRKRASVIFTVSNFSKSELLRLTRGARSDNIITTHLGVEPEWYGASLFPSRRPCPYFLHVGNIKPYKNLGRLVEAFLRICDRVPHDLVIVGQGEGLITGESQQFFDRVKASERIHLTGFVAHKELLSLVGHAAALVMPSLYEGFGLPPLEAMAAGTPVVVARNASLPEVCGDAALYFDPLNIDDLSTKLLAVGVDTGIGRELSRKGIAQSRLFTWQACSRKTAEALRRCMELPIDSRSLFQE